MISIIIQANSYYDNSYLSEFSKYKDIEKLYSTKKGNINHLNDAVEYIKENDDSIYRIAKYPVSIINTSILYNYNGISSYYSIGNGCLYDFVKEMELNRYNALQIFDYNNRTDILTMVGVKYLISDEENSQYVPYGYSLYKQIEDTKIYKNDNYLPLGIFYDKYITKEQYDNLTTLEKQVSLLEYAKVDENIDGVEQGNKETLGEKLNEIEYSIVKEEDKKIELKPENLDDGELYVVINNINFEPENEKSSSSYTLNASYGEVSVSGKVLDESATYYVERENFVLNLGQIQENENIKLEFESADGEIKHDDIKLVVISNEKYEEQVENLKDNTLEDIQYQGNTISGKINNQKNGILQLSIPYSSGWKVYVDGVEKEVINVNTGFIGVELEAGNHEITFSYTTPWLYAGIIITIVGFIIFFAIVIYETIYLKRKKYLEEKYE